MLKYRRIFANGSISRYEFYPEGNGAAGIVEFTNGIGRIVKNSTDDFESFYSSHALNIDCNTESGTIAWF